MNRDTWVTRDELAVREPETGEPAGPGEAAGSGEEAGQEAGEAASPEPDSGGGG
jgi:hypothetical protein